MEKYAILNSNNIAESISTYYQTLQNPPKNYIKVQDDSMLWHKYENGVWSTDKFEPQSTAPINEFTAMKNQIDALNVAMANLVGGAS